MDTLQPVTSTEQLIAQGEYNYQVSSKDSGLREFWSLHKLPDGTLVHRAEVGGSITLLSLNQKSHFVLTADYQPCSLHMSQNIQAKAAARTARTTIRCFEQSVVQTIETENLSDKKVIEVPSAYSLFFPPVSAQGFIVKNYDLEAGGRQHLPLVSIRIQPESGLPLSIKIQSVDYEYQENDREIETPAGRDNHIVGRINVNYKYKLST